MTRSIAHDRVAPVAIRRGVRSRGEHAVPRLGPICGCHIVVASGSLLWTVRALVGSRRAEKELARRRYDRKQAQAGPVTRGLRTLGDRRT